MRQIRTGSPSGHRTQRRRTGVVMLLTAGLTGCAATAVVPGEHRGTERAVEIGALAAADVAAAHRAFGIDLLHAVCAEAPGENLLLSPSSAALALGLLHPAAGGATGDALSAVLHLPTWSDDLVAAEQQLTDALAGLAHDGDPGADDAPDFLNVSNRVWTADGLEPEQAYLDDVATAFDAGVRQVDFAGDAAGATDQINAAVRDDTAGIIEELFGEPLRPNTVAVLTNAVHLKARWAVPFTHTESSPFHTLVGETTVELMEGGSGYAQTVNGWVSVELPYRDGTLAAVGVLPPQGTDPCAVDEAVLAGSSAARPDGAGAGDGEAGEAGAGDAVEAAREVGVTLPRLRLEQTHQLLELLEGLGLQRDGDYSALCGDCAVSQVVQKTFLEVDEEGTEAAAATGVAMEESAAVVQEVVTFDRPFLLLLTDTETRSPLFFAVIHDPSA